MHAEGFVQDPEKVNNLMEVSQTMFIVKQHSMK